MPDIIHISYKGCTGRRARVSAVAQTLQARTGDEQAEHQQTVSRQQLATAVGKPCSAGHVAVHAPLSPPPPPPTLDGRHPNTASPRHKPQVVAARAASCTLHRASEALQHTATAQIAMRRGSSLSLVNQLAAFTFETNSNAGCSISTVEWI
jgi:hypothetical protein